jgi:hypothetical protein
VYIGVYERIKVCVLGLGLKISFFMVFSACPVILLANSRFFEEKQKRMS